MKRGFAGFDDGPIFPCWIDDRDRWNGWHKPWFNSSTCRAIIEYLDTSKMRYLPAVGFFHVDPDDGPDPYIFPAITIDGTDYHQLGAGIYCWNDCSRLPCCGRPRQTTDENEDCPDCGQ